MKKLHPVSVFKPWIVRRPDGGCQVLFPLSELDGLISQILPRWRSVTEEPPPYDTGMLISDGKDVTAAEYCSHASGSLWRGWTPYGVYGNGYDQELVMTTDDIKWWMPLPDPPKEA